jgi:uncharacterized membrane protein
MYIVPIAWIYVALMMSVAEATNSTGTVLGAVVTFVFYGVLPVALMMYFMGTPSRKRALRAQEEAARAAAIAAHQAVAQSDASHQPDAGSLPAADLVAPVAKEP